MEYTYDKRGNLEYVPDSQNPDVHYTYTGDNLVDEVYDNYCYNYTYMVWDADQQRINVNRDFGEDWLFINDPTAGIPAVLLVQYFNGESYTYTFNVREPGGRLLASFEPTGANLHYYHFDNLGSTVLVTNGSGTVSQTYAYDAWGNALSGGDGLKPYQYVGELGYYTHSTAQGSALADLMQLGVRFYDPEIGRFTQRDPAQDGMNWYVYVGDRPLVATDPSGESIYVTIIKRGSMLVTAGLGYYYTSQCIKCLRRAHELRETMWEHYGCPEKAKELGLDPDAVKFRSGICPEYDDWNARVKPGEECKSICLKAGYTDAGFLASTAWNLGLLKILSNRMTWVVIPPMITKVIYAGMDQY